MMWAHIYIHEYIYRICMYMCMCIFYTYTYMYMYIYIYVYTHIHIHICICICICMYVYIYVHIYICTHTNSVCCIFELHSTYVNALAPSSSSMHLHIHINTHIYMHICIYMYIYIHTNSLCRISQLHCTYINARCIAFPWYMRISQIQQTKSFQTVNGVASWHLSICEMKQGIFWLHCLLLVDDISQTTTSFSIYSLKSLYCSVLRILILTTREADTVIWEQHTDIWKWVWLLWEFRERISLWPRERISLWPISIIFKSELACHFTLQIE